MRKRCAFGTGISGIGSKITTKGVIGEVSSDILVQQALSGLANLLSSKDHSGVLGDSITDSTGSNMIMAMGGKVKGKVEVEGGEVAELPDSQLLQFKGASHEAGGIDVDLPTGTTIYSDRLSVDGKTMQERKKARESKLRKIDNYLADGKTDVISRNGFNRTKSTIEKEENSDLLMQQIANETYSTPKEKMAFGTGLFGLGEDNDPLYPAPQSYYDKANGVETLPDQLPLTKGQTAKDGLFNGLVKSDMGEIADYHPLAVSELNFPHSNVVKPYTIPMPQVPIPKPGLGFTPGDITGMIGNLVGGVAPLVTTVANRAGDKPNINAFKGFGADAIASNKRAMSTVDSVKDSALQDIQLQETGARNRNRNSASSVNTLRALDTVTDLAGDQASNSVYDNFSKQMMSLFGQESQLENIQDNAVMTGNQRADEADRADRDNFFTNLGQNFVNLSTTAQKTGKDLNTKKENQDFLDLLPDLSKYMLGYEQDKNGKWIIKKQAKG